jgi:hypothetical protein
VTSPEIPFTTADILVFDLQQLLSHAESKTCRAYEAIFVAKAQGYGESGDKKSQAMCELFAIFCSFGLDFNNPNDTYIPAWTLLDRHSLVPSDIQQDYVDLLREIVEDLKDADLRARIADVLWVLRKGNFQVAGIAIEAYLESASILEDPRAHLKIR